MMRWFLILYAIIRPRYCLHCGRRLRGIATAPEIPVHLSDGLRSCIGWHCGSGPGTLAEWS